MPVPRNNPRRAEMVREAQKLHKQGLSLREIAKELEVAPSTASTYIRDPSGKQTRAKNREHYLRAKGRRTKEMAEVEFNRMELPISTKITMRPVWQRRQRRIYGQNKLPPISEAEKQDAIKILGDLKLQEQAPALYFEAFLIFDEASR